jgi:hypothetical protein
MGIDGRTKHNGIAPTDFIQDLRFANNAGQFGRMLFGVTKSVNSVTDPQFVQPRAQIQKHAHLTSGSWLATNYPSNQFPGITVERQPTIWVEFLVKKI